MIQLILVIVFIYLIIPFLQSLVVIMVNVFPSGVIAISNALKGLLNIFDYDKGHS